METKKLVKSSILIAIAVVLSLVKIIQLPFGGAVTLGSMVPIILIGFMYGKKWGVISGAVYGLLYMLTDMSVVSAMFMPGDSQMVVWQGITICLSEYIGVGMLLGLSGVFKDKIKNEALAITLGALLVTFLVFVVHFVSGCIFYGAWAEWFFEQYSFGKSILQKYNGFSLVALYNLIYNGSYMIFEIVISTIVSPILFKILSKGKII